MVGRTLLLSALLFSGCYSFVSPPREPLRQYDLRVVNQNKESLVLYYVAGRTSLGTLARMEPYSERRLRIPSAFRDRTGLRVLVCIGRNSPTARCTVAVGEIQFGYHGTIVTVFPSSNLAAMVNG